LTRLGASYWDGGYSGNPTIIAFAARMCFAGYDPGADQPARAAWNPAHGARNKRHWTIFGDRAVIYAAEERHVLLTTEKICAIVDNIGGSSATSEAIINPYRTGTGSDEASDGHLIIRLLGSRLRNEWSARDLPGSVKPINAKDSKLSQMDMNEPRSTRLVGISFPHFRRDMAHALAPLRPATPACVRLLK
jgi:hypothetical protein